MGGPRILVADCSATYKKMFTQAAEELDKNAVVTCVTGENEALDKIKRQDYEIVIVDAEISNQIALIEEITQQIPKAFVLITARPSKAENDICIEALAKGAADCLTKPIQSSYSENYNAVKNKMDDIFRILAKERGQKPDLAKQNQYRTKKTIKKSRFHPAIVLIASSTGGPMALENILPKLGKDFPVPILIVQHMLLQFTETLAQNLDQRSALKVKVAENREAIEAGTVYIAPGGTHMKLDNTNRIRLEDSPPINGIRPAADMLFASIAESFSGTGVLAVILTGMGRDGESGLARLKEKLDCFCIAQSEGTCVVYGMPRAAVESGLADKILDLDKIPSELESFDFANEKGANEKS